MRVSTDIKVKSSCWKLGRFLRLTEDELNAWYKYLGNHARVSRLCSRILNQLQLKHKLHDEYILWIDRAITTTISYTVNFALSIHGHFYSDNSEKGRYFQKLLHQNSGIEYTKS